MAKRFGICKRLGVGDDLDPYRAAILDVLDPDTQGPAFEVVAAFEGTPGGSDVCVFVASGKRFSLVAGNADIDLFPEATRGVALAGIGTAARAAMQSAIATRTGDASWVALSLSMGEVVERLVQDVPGYEAVSIDDFDVIDP